MNLAAPSPVQSFAGSTCLYCVPRPRVPGLWRAVLYLAILAVVGLPAPGHAATLAFERLVTHPGLRWETYPDFGVYSGIIRDRATFERIWGMPLNIDKPVRSFLGIPEKPPEVDFGRYDLLWFADAGAQASFTELEAIEVLESEGVLVARVRVVHSGFASRRLNFWKIPKHNLSVRFEELHEYDSNPVPSP